MPDRSGNGRFWNWNVTSTLIIIACTIIVSVFGWLALSVQSNVEDIADLRTTTAVNAKVLEIATEDIPDISARLASVDRRLIRLEAHFGTLPKEDRMGEVLIEWKVRSARMTSFGVIPRAPGDQDTMKLREAKDLARCGIVKILGKPKDVVESAAEILEGEG